MVVIGKPNNLDLLTQHVTSLEGEKKENFLFGDFYFLWEFIRVCISWAAGSYKLMVTLEASCTQFQQCVKLCQDLSFPQLG